MSRLLFVDDNVKNWELIHQRLPNSVIQVHWATTVEEAIEDLDKWTSALNIIFLEHDLADELCGCILVDWLIDRKELFKKVRIVLHSSNIEGSQAMHEALKNAGLSSSIHPLTDEVSV